MTQPSADRLALLYRVSQTFNSSLDLDAVLTRVMDEVITATRAERGFLMLRDADGRLAFRAARGMERQTIDAPEFQISRGLVERVAAEGQPQLASDAQSDGWLNQRASVTGLRLRSILCVPLQRKDATFGVIYVDNRLHAGVFAQDDLELLSALARLAASAIENARLFGDAHAQLSSLRLLRDISADLTSTLDLDRVLQTCLQRVQDLLGVATASILMVEGSELVFQVAIGDKSSQVKPFRIPIGQGIAGWVAQNARAVFSNDVSRDPRFYRTVDTGTGFVTQALMAAPLTVNERVIGVVEVSNKPGGFTDADVDLLTTIAGSAAMAIENARLYQVAVEKGRMERELQVALQVQTSLIPAQTPQIPGWEFAALWKPARVVGGDYYDFIPVGAVHAAPLRGIVIADVADKGMGAAMFMTLTRAVVRASIAAARAPAEGISRANALIAADAANGMFVTLFYAQLNPATGAFTYVNAGHNPPIHYRAKTNQWEELTRTGLALGINDAFEYAQRAVTVEPGDFIVLYTDGVTEAHVADGELFGDERWQRVIEQKKNSSAAEIVAAADAALHEFMGGAPPFDDVTVVVLKRL